MRFFQRLALALFAVAVVSEGAAHAQSPAMKSQPSAETPAPPRWLEPYREPASRLIGAAMVDSFAWRRLAELTDGIGNRLSGTPELA